MNDGVKADGQEGEGDEQGEDHDPWKESTALE